MLNTTQDGIALVVRTDLTQGCKSRKKSSRGLIVVRSNCLVMFQADVLLPPPNVQGLFCALRHWKVLDDIWDSSRIWEVSPGLEWDLWFLTLAKGHVLRWKTNQEKSCFWSNPVKMHFFSVKMQQTAWICRVFRFFGTNHSRGASTGLSNSGWGRKNSGIDSFLKIRTGVPNFGKETVFSTTCDLWF